MRDPLAIDFFRDTQFALIQATHYFFDGKADRAIWPMNVWIEFVAFFPRLFDGGFELVEIHGILNLRLKGNY